MEIHKHFKSTKVICTIGPSSWDNQTLERLVKAGMNIARLNFSHGTFNSFQEVISSVRKLSTDLEEPIGILQDLQGPKIRVDELPEGEIGLITDQEVILTLAKHASHFDNPIPIQFDFIPYIKPGDQIFLDDGYMKLVVLKKKPDHIVVRVINGGLLKSNQGINLPDTFLPDASLTHKDKEDLAFGMKYNVDFVGLSFVQTLEDVQSLRRILHRHDCDARIVVKIERKAAVENLEAIIEATDAVMVARGDLAIEVGLTEVPIIQKRIIQLCRQYQKPVIIATQILESMINNPRPTRAEVNDAATAVFDQVDALMLSAESASGKYPVEATETMTSIIKRVEKSGIRENWFSLEGIFHTSKQTQAIAMAAVVLAEKIGADAIVVGTASGNAARALSSFRPSVPIFAVTENNRVYSQLSLDRGVRSFRMRKVKSAEEFIQSALSDIVKKGLLNRGAKVVVASGTHTGIPGGTNLIKVTTI